MREGLETAINHDFMSLIFIKRLGFEAHGIAKNYLYLDGRWRDHILTSLVNLDWK